MFATAEAPINVAVAHDSAVIVFLLDSAEFPPEVPPLEPEPGKMTDAELLEVQKQHAAMILAGREMVDMASKAASAASKACVVS